MEYKVNRELAEEEYQKLCDNYGIDIDLIIGDENIKDYEELKEKLILYIMKGTVGVVCEDKIAMIYKTPYKNSPFHNKEVKLREPKIISMKDSSLKGTVKEGLKQICLSTDQSEHDFNKISMAEFKLLTTIMNFFMT